MEVLQTIVGFIGALMVLSGFFGCWVPFVLGAKSSIPGESEMLERENEVKTRCVKIESALVRQYKADKGHKPERPVRNQLHHEAFAALRAFESSREYQRIEELKSKQNKLFIIRGLMGLGLVGVGLPLVFWGFQNW